jgi:hypothetical protein
MVTRRADVDQAEAGVAMKRPMLHARLPRKNGDGLDSGGSPWRALTLAEVEGDLCAIQIATPAPAAGAAAAREIPVQFSRRRYQGQTQYAESAAPACRGRG